MSGLHYFRPAWLVPADDQRTADVAIYRLTSGG